MELYTAQTATSQHACCVSSAGWSLQVSLAACMSPSGGHGGGHRCLGSGQLCVAVHDAPLLSHCHRWRATRPSSSTLGRPWPPARRCASLVPVGTGPPRGMANPEGDLRVRGTPLPLHLN